MFALTDVNVMVRLKSREEESCCSKPYYLRSYTLAQVAFSNGRAQQGNRLASDGPYVICQDFLNPVSQSNGFRLGR